MLGLQSVIQDTLWDIDHETTLNLNHSIMSYSELAWSWFTVNTGWLLLSFLTVNLAVRGAGRQAGSSAMATWTTAEGRVAVEGDTESVAGDKVDWIFLNFVIGSETTKSDVSFSFLLGLVFLLPSSSSLSLFFFFELLAVSAPAAFAFPLFFVLFLLSSFVIVCFSSSSSSPLSLWFPP